MPDIIRDEPQSRRKYRFSSGTISNELTKPKSISVVGSSVLLDNQNKPIKDTEVRERGMDYTINATEIDPTTKQEVPATDGLRTVTILDKITNQNVTISGIGIMDALAELVSIVTEPKIDQYIAKKRGNK
jgi:hypothetical protein